MLPIEKPFDRPAPLEIVGLLTAPDIYMRCLDDAEQPEDQDQQQQTAKTDIHDFLPYSCCC